MAARIYARTLVGDQWLHDLPMSGPQVAGRKSAAEWETRGYKVATGGPRAVHLWDATESGWPGGAVRHSTSLPLSSDWWQSVWATGGPLETFY